MNRDKSPPLPYSRQTIEQRIQEEVFIVLKEVFDRMQLPFIIFISFALTASAVQTLAGKASFGFFLYQVLLSVIVLVAASLRRRLSPAAVFYAILAVVYAVGVAAIFNRGLSGSGMVHLIFFCVLTGTYLGIRMGLASLAFTLATIVLLGTGICLGTIPMKPDAAAYLVHPANWLLQIAILAMYAILLILSVKGLQQKMAEAQFDLVDNNERLEEEIALRRRTEEELRASEVKYRNIFENAVEGIFQVTPEGRLIGANPALARMHGFDSPEDMLAADLDVSQDYYADPEQRQTFVTRIYEEDTISCFEFEAYRRDGRRMWISMNARAVRDAEGRVIYHEGTMEDISERKAAEEQLRQAYQAIQESQDMLIQADKLVAVGTLAAGVAHEILNPVNIISTGMAVLQATETLPTSVKEAFEVFGRQVVRITGITRSLQQFSRKSPGILESTDLADLVLNTVRLCEPRLKMEEVEVHIDVVRGIPRILMDPNRMEQVFVNIINNAVDAMSGKKEKILTIRTERTVGTGDSHGWSRITISDSGMGIAEEDLKRIFDPFFTTKTVGQGTGLGLSVSHGIVQSHGGFIWAENNAGSGASFIIELPDLPPQSESAAPVQAELSGDEPAGEDHRKNNT